MLLYSKRKKDMYMYFLRIFLDFQMSVYFLGNILTFENLKCLNNIDHLVDIYNVLDLE